MYALSHTQETQKNVEDQLQATMAELSQLRLREQQLLAKNQLLEKLAHLNGKRSKLQVSVMTAGAGMQFFMLIHERDKSVHIAVSIQCNQSSTADSSMLSVLPS